MEENNNNIRMYNSVKTYRQDLIELKKILTGEKELETWHKEILLPRIINYIKPYESTLPKIKVHVEVKECCLRLNGEIFRCQMCGNTIFSKLSDDTYVCRDCKTIYDINE